MMSPMFRPRRAFTLVELLIAVSVLGIFLFFAYRLFMGGQKVAGKAQWIGMIIDQQRNATQQLNIQLKSTSYPTTLLPDGIYDPSSKGAPANAADQYYVKLDSGMTVKSSTLSGEKVIMSWVCCEPERPPTPGVIVENQLTLTPVHNTLVKVAIMKLRSRGFSFTTNPSGPANQRYAQSGSLSKAAKPELNRDYHLVDDVEEVRFLMPATPPVREPQPIKIEIRSLYPKDPKVFKENALMITPNVGIGTL